MNTLKDGKLGKFYLNVIDKAERFCYNLIKKQKNTKQGYNI